MMSDKLEDWIDDTFSTFPGYYETDNDSYESRILYIKKFTNEWKKINIYEYYDGFQITLYTTNMKKKVLIYSNSTDTLMNIIGIVYKMNNLEEFCFGSKFVKEYPRYFFWKPLQSVKVIRVNSIHLIHRNFLSGSKKLFVNPM